MSAGDFKPSRLQKQSAYERGVAHTKLMYEIQTGKRPPSDAIPPLPPGKAFFFARHFDRLKRRGTGASVAAIYHARHILPGEPIPNTWNHVRDRARDGILNAQRLLADYPREVLADVLIERARLYGWLYGINRRAQSVMEFVGLIEDAELREEAAPLAMESEQVGRDEGNARRRVQGVSKQRYCVVRACWSAYKANRKLWHAKGMPQFARKEFVFSKDELLQLADSFAHEHAYDCNKQNLLDLPDDPFHRPRPFAYRITPQVAGKVIKQFIGGKPVKQGGIVRGWCVQARHIERAMELLQAEVALTPKDVEAVGKAKHRSGMIPMWHRFAAMPGKVGEVFAEHLHRIAPVSGYAYAPT